MYVYIDTHKTTGRAFMPEHLIAWWCDSVVRVLDRVKGAVFWGEGCRLVTAQHEGCRLVTAQHVSLWLVCSRE